MRNFGGDSSKRTIHRVGRLSRNLSALALALALGGLGLAHGSGARSKAVLEVYSAIDHASGPARPVVMDEEELGEIPVVDSDNRGTSDAIVITNTSKKSQNRTTAAKESFDPVPNDQVGLIVKRLRLVERLLRDHGRAYDYRVHTLRELEEILNHLETSAPKGPSRKSMTDLRDMG